MSRAWRRCISISVAAGTIAMIVPATYSDAGSGQLVAQAGPAAPYPTRDAVLVNAEAVSCKELKDKLQSAGTLDILSGQKGWGETFYGPGVPQCQFWQRPQFTYVSTNDGSCGVGYICAQRVTGGR